MQHLIKRNFHAKKDAQNGEASVDQAAQSPDVISEIETPQDVSDALDDARAPNAEAASNVCLIVDDSRVIRKISSKIVKSMGYVPLEAQDGEDALARCKKAMPKFVITDWNMPEMDGLEFVKRLRAIPTPNPPVVIFCTSKGTAADVNAGVRAGANDYIVKPFKEETLRAKLEKHA